MFHRNSALLLSLSFFLFTGVACSTKNKEVSTTAPRALTAAKSTITKDVKPVFPVKPVTEVPTTGAELDTAPAASVLEPAIKNIHETLHNNPEEAGPIIQDAMSQALNSYSFSEGVTAVSYKSDEDGT